MNNNHPKTAKRPFRAERPFPWKCHHCFKNQVVMRTVSYDAEFRHDGRLHEFTVPALKIPICEACGEKVFTEEVDDQITDELRSHLHLLTPAEMRTALKRLDLTQKEAAARLGIAEATLSRWLTDTQIQSRALDNLLRLFFAFPVVRAALHGEGNDRKFSTMPENPMSLEEMCPALAKRLAANSLDFSDVNQRLAAPPSLPGFTGASFSRILTAANESAARSKTLRLSPQN